MLVLVILSTYTAKDSSLELNKSRLKTHSSLTVSLVTKASINNGNKTFSIRKRKAKVLSKLRSLSSYWLENPRFSF